MPMSDYLSTVTPDYTAVQLDINPQGQGAVIDSIGRRYQDVTEYYGGNDTRIDWGNNPEFFVTLPYGYITQAQFNIIWDLYLNSSKANGIGRSFVWSHPTDGNDYTVRFYNVIEKWEDPASNMGINGVVLKVLGNYSVLTGAILDQSGSPILDQSGGVIYDQTV